MATLCGHLYSVWWCHILSLSEVPVLFMSCSLFIDIGSPLKQVAPISCAFLYGNISVRPPCWISQTEWFIISFFIQIPLSSALPRQHVEWLFMCLTDIHKASTVFLEWSFCECKHRTDNYKTARSNLLQILWGDLCLAAISHVYAQSPQFVYFLSRLPHKTNHYMWLLWGLALIRLWHHHVGSWWCNYDMSLSWYPFKTWKLFKIFVLISSFCFFLLILQIHSFITSCCKMW